MINLNSTNGADILLLETIEKILKEFDTFIIAAEFGIAYGGGIESIGKLLKNKGIVYGFDTFEGHPDFLSKKDPLCNYDINSFAARCMDKWKEIYDNKLFSIEHIQLELDKQNLNNVILQKGIIDDNFTAPIKYLNYCLIDLDIPISMENAYKSVKDKIIKGGYLCLHDVVPKNHINGLFEWYKNILENDGYELVNEYPKSYLAILKKK